jgi:hypothetical protein
MRCWAHGQSANLAQDYATAVTALERVATGQGRRDAHGAALVRGSELDERHRPPQRAVDSYLVRLPDRFHDRLVVGADDKIAQARTARRPSQVGDRGPSRLPREVDPYQSEDRTCAGPRVTNVEVTAKKTAAQRRRSGHAGVQVRLCPGAHHRTAPPRPAR